MEELTVETEEIQVQKILTKEKTIPQRLLLAPNKGF